MQKSKDQKYLNELCRVLISIKNTAEMKEFLYGLLTSKELEEIQTRIQIVKQLKQGVPQHRIASDLRIGVATVTRGSRELKLGRFNNI